MSHAFAIRPTTEADWEEIRDLRIEMIRDTAIGYAETLESALGHDEAEWKMRGRRGDAEHGTSIAAITEAGRWVGMMGVIILDPAAAPLLVGVYVAPDVRGRENGVTDGLLSVVEDWARNRGDRLTLGVHEDNARARTAYERRGFSLTGHTLPYNLDPTRNELEMVKTI